jgi:putative ABC transport system permease protein
MDRIVYADRMTDLVREAHVTLRSLARRPLFALAVVATLAVTIGANLAMFSVVDGVLLRSLPYASPDGLVWMASVTPDNSNASFSLPEFMDYREQTRTLSGLAAYAGWTASLTGDGVSQRLQGARMSADAFDVLGARPSTGRLLHATDDRADAPPVAVVSRRLWLRQFGGREDVLGRSVRINGATVEIVGVLPALMPLPLQDIDVVVPLCPERDPLRHERGSVSFLRLVGRLGPGVSLQQAAGELTTIARGLRRQFPTEYARKDAVRLVPLREAITGGHRGVLLLLLGSVVVVQGAALANLLALMLVRAHSRRGEFAIRAAVGGTRLQIARQAAIESLMLAVAGSSVGWLLASWILVAVVRWAPASVPRISEAALTPRTLGLAAVLTAASGALLAAATVSVAGRARARDALRLTGRGAVSDRVSNRIRSFLVAGQIATSVVLLLITTLLIRNLARLQDVPTGFRLDDAFQARVWIPPSYHSPAEVAAFCERLSRKLETVPGVRQVGLVSIAPMSGLGLTVPFDVADQPARDGRDRVSANYRVITPDYLAAAGTRLIQGRAFAETDGEDAPPVALVSAALAARFLSSGALGRRLLIDDNNEGPRPVEVVGVVENVLQSALDLPPAHDVYLPLRQLPPENVSLIRNNQFWVMRTERAPASYRRLFAASLREVDPDAAASGAGPMRESVDAWLGPRRFNAGLFLAFTLTSVLLAVFGLYGLVSYSVSQRRREIGVRMALGAGPRDIRRMILTQAARVGAAGIASGLLVSLVAWRHVSPAPWSVVVIACALMSVVIAAAWLPARRAAATRPLRALQEE